MLVSALSTAQSRGCAKHVGKNRATSQPTELGVFHAQLWWLPRACRYAQLVSLGRYVFLAQFPEEMRLMHSCWVCVGAGTRVCVSLSLQASPLEILNPLIAFNPIWLNTGDINFQQVQWNGQPIGKANPFECPPWRQQLQNKSTIYWTPETPYGIVWKIIYQCTTNGKSSDKILPFHRYPSHPVSKHNCVGKQASPTLALTEQFSFLIFHCNCFLLIWVLKCIVGHDPAGPSTNGSDGRGEDLT